MNKSQPPSELHALTTSSRVTAVLLLLVIGVLGCNSAAEKPDTGAGYTHENECENTKDCFSKIGFDRNFHNPDNVWCRHRDLGNLCIECLTDDDCPDGFYCKSQLICEHPTGDPSASDAGLNDAGLGDMYGASDVGRSDATLDIGGHDSGGADAARDIGGDAGDVD